ncbi:2-amino-4-hydroxy-6-hydroxymethyldihydropteridine pyrophosphokinase, partial [Candidatus Endoriftia persephone str. Guaymas]|nr:2-amino-4-hydroxy-6-hydroxymethyldihydropteridine pyrophosphokinase [Candidatus Endoriftia persephone str. Guaymas]
VLKLRWIEEKNGRQRESDKFAPRTLDVDLLTYGDVVVDEPGLQLPRDEITRYAFVLLPLSEVAGDEIHPVTGQSYRELWRAFNAPEQRLWRAD